MKQGDLVKVLRPHSSHRGLALVIGDEQYHSEPGQSYTKVMLDLGGVRILPSHWLEVIK